jgi:hypothetical protein
MSMHAPHADRTRTRAGSATGHRDLRCAGRDSGPIELRLEQARAGQSPLKRKRSTRLSHLGLFRRLHSRSQR